MPVVNPLAREVVFKIVYYGPGLGGKTTSLQHIHATTRPEHRGKMVSLATPVDRTLYFDFLPIRLPSVRSMNVRLQLFTVPGQVYYNATRKLVLTGADGLVMVFDSQLGRSDANIESLENLRENLEAHGRDLATIPHVILYNKRDLYDAQPLEDLERQLNRERAPSFSAVATKGEGVYEGLEAVTRAVLDDFEKRMPEASASLGASLDAPEGGLLEALRGARAPSEAAQRREPEPDAEPELPRRPPPADLRLSQLPDMDAGEVAARAVTGERAPTPMPPAPPEPPLRHVSEHVREPQSRPPGVGFELLWPPTERGLVLELEAALSAGDPALALRACEALVARSLAGAAAALGTNDAPRDPATMALVLGIDGRRYLAFRSLAREARQGRAVSPTEALSAYALAIQIRIARAGI
jgi:signal recognition particle receptor subunit beta